MTTQVLTPVVSQVIFSNPDGLNVSAITEAQLVDMLRQNKGATIVTIVTRTEPGMRKTGNPFVGKVVKISRVNGMLGFNYSNSVNRQLEREGEVADFVAQPRKWGIRIEGTPLVEHEGNFYVEMKVEKSLGHRFEWTDNGTILDDKAIEDMKAFMPIKSSSSSQGTDKEIILRDYKVASIIAITYRGHCYLVAR